MILLSLRAVIDAIISPISPFSPLASHIMPHYFATCHTLPLITLIAFRLLRSAASIFFDRDTLVSFLKTFSLDTSRHIFISMPPFLLCHFAIDAGLITQPLFSSLPAY